MPENETMPSASHDFEPMITTAAKPWTTAPQPDPAVLRFAVVGDRTGLARAGVFEQAMIQLSWMQPEFVVAVGDLVEGYTEDADLLRPELDQLDRAIAAGGLPFFFVAGNHDLGTDTQLALWRERRGDPWYSFKYKDVLFLVLDSEDPPMPMPPPIAQGFRETVDLLKVDPAAAARSMVEGQADGSHDLAMAALGPLDTSRLSQDQIDWAKRVLSDNSGVRWTFVFIHKPAWREDTGFAEIEAALGARDFTVFAGHKHYYQRERRNERDFLIMGTTGGIPHTDGAGKMDHFAWVTLGAGPPAIALVKLTGVLDLDGASGQPSAL